VSGATTTSAGGQSEIDPALLAGIVQRVSAPGFARFRGQLRSSGYCAHPVGLRGEIRTCEGRRVWSTDSEPDGVLRKACGNRREAVCPQCAERYRQDAYHLISAGLRGGKGVPASVTAHPFVFVTLTAPSFGAVHSRPLGADGKPRRCRPRRDVQSCEHGVRLSCGKVHDEDEPCLGRPLCVECFDHQGAVLWNNMLGELWRRTTVYLPRHLAAVLGVTQKRLRELVRVSYIKVAEYQARGLVHLHVVIRIDRAMPNYRQGEIRPPDARFTGRLLEHAVQGAIEAVSAPIAEDLAADLGQRRVRWGQEREVRPVEDPGQLAGYLAKYSTKSTEQAGGLLHPIDQAAVETVKVSEHMRGYLRTAFTLHHMAQRSGRERRAQLGTDVRRKRHDPRLARNAHKLGFRGHCLTKSQRWSTTFKALRQAREQHVHRQLLARHGVPDSQRQLTQLDPELRITRFEFAGVGHVTACRRVPGRSGRRPCARVSPAGARGARVASSGCGKVGAFTVKAAA
jgi:hypothetical protein